MNRYLTEKAIEHADLAIRDLENEKYYPGRNHARYAESLSRDDPAMISFYDNVKHYHVYYAIHDLNSYTDMAMEECM